MAERIHAINRCMSELAKCRRDMHLNPVGALLGQMDWLSELHALIHG